jgi:two-component system response regulator ChvI
MPPTANAVPAGVVALVDDEESLRETVAFALRREGYRVDVYADGLEAWQAFQQKLPDLAVLDILMPRLDGRELCRRLRAASEALPIMFLTSRDDEFDRVLGLELGADDYLCKPFSVRELMARIKVLFRRAALNREPRTEDGEPAEILTSGDLMLDIDRHEVRWKEGPLPLTVTEFRLLAALVRHPGHVKTREQLLEEAYPHDTYLAERSIDSHIKRLRRKFEDADASFGAIETVYGLGYRWIGEP